MPGKVNPVVPEVVEHRRVPRHGERLRRVARRAQRAAPAQRLRAARTAWSIIESQALLFNVSKLFRTKCVDGITVNEKQLAHYLETTVGIVTALNPVIGYEKATELAAEAYKSGKGMLEIIREKKILTEEQIKTLLDPAT